MNHITRLPAYIFHGQKEPIEQHIEQLLQKVFCKTAAEESDCWCTNCKNITARQHHGIVWINPEKDYTNKDLEIVFAKIRFTLEQNEHFFFIFSDAHRLTPTTANRLLKSVEEPPTGYHFIFLTNNVQSILPTIRSRCSIEYLSTVENDEEQHPLISFFLNNTYDPILFESTLKTHTPTHTQAQEIVQKLLEHLRTNIRDHCKSSASPVGALDISYQQKLLEQIEHHMRTPPQSGSGSLFFKMLYMKKALI